MAAVERDMTNQVLIKEDDNPFFFEPTYSRPMAYIRPPQSTEPASGTKQVCVLQAFWAKWQKYLNFCAAWTYNPGTGGIRLSILA